MNIFYKLDENKNVVPGRAEDAIEIYNNPERKVVKQDYVGNKLISTVFLSIDHGCLINSENYKPVLFETMVFDEKLDRWLDFQERYCTWVEAEEGHNKTIELVKGWNCNMANKDIEESPYPSTLTKIADVLLAEIEKYYPGLINNNFDECGRINASGTPAMRRAEMCIYVELMKAGAFEDENKK